MPACMCAVPSDISVEQWSNAILAGIDPGKISIYTISFYSGGRWHRMTLTRREWHSLKGTLLYVCAVCWT